MAGIIQNAIDSTNQNNVYGAATTPVTATTREVDPAKETVQGQLSTILSSGNPYVEQAKSGAAEGANSRGLLNTSMAAGAGEAAAIAAAAPIAGADANTYSTAAQQNQAVKNQTDQFNAGATNTSNLNTANAANTTVQQGQKGGQAVTLANIEASYKGLMQTSASASQYFTQASKNISDILADPNTSAEQKQSAVDKQTQLLNQTMTAIGAIGNVDIASLVQF